MATNIYNPVSNSFNAFGGLVSAQSAIDLLNKWEIKEQTLTRAYTKTFVSDNSKLYSIGNIGILCINVILNAEDIGTGTKVVYYLPQDCTPPSLTAYEIVHNASRNKQENYVYISGTTVRISQASADACQVIIPFPIIGEGGMITE